MKTCTRRIFIRSTAASAAYLATNQTLLALEADNAYRKNIGIQLYTLRNELKKDTAGTIKAVAEAGYKQVEPYGFPNADAMIKAARDNGLAVNSTHFAWEAITEPDKQGVPSFASILDKAKENGLTHLVVPYLPEHNRKTLDDYKRLTDQMNKGAAEAKEAGMQFAYHNHAFEFEKKEGGRTGYEIFAGGFSPDMKFEVDVFWVKVGGVEPVDLIQELKGRVSQLHLKDLKKGFAVPNFGHVPGDAFKELGSGMIPMEPILEAAKAAGVEHCHVEQDQSPDPLASIRQSAEYLRTL